jgi:hypothetical protein
VETARARHDTALAPELLDELRECYDEAVRSGIIHNRLRDWDTGNHPGYALGCWLRDYKEQVLLFTRDFAVDWTNNVSERRQSRQAPSGGLGLLAFHGRPRPLVPHQELPRFGRRPRHHRTRRYLRNHQRKALATAAPRNCITPNSRNP